MCCKCNMLVVYKPKCLRWVEKGGSKQATAEVFGVSGNGRYKASIVVSPRPLLWLQLLIREEGTHAWMWSQELGGLCGAALGFIVSEAITNTWYCNDSRLLGKSY
ncbi:hypothetical protein IFM89_038041 [Coptis chinensis]|uniref:Uncharacterized protein n=1 Tax=Coptis chinensis TaxID=261450 RepID=A0A835LDN3_9MAGN|nr:hypothetical protein IFM89_038041 [Coptis chinensis]